MPACPTWSGKFLGAGEEDEVRRLVSKRASKLSLSIYGRDDFSRINHHEFPGNDEKTARRYAAKTGRIGGNEGMVLAGRGAAPVRTSDDPSAFMKDP